MALNSLYGSAAMKEQLLNMHNLYVWAKDESCRYVYVNENYAKAAGADSPAQMIGKTDDHMAWRHFAKDFQQGDYEAMKGKTRVNSIEQTATADGSTDILVTETQLLDSSGDVIGVQGSYIDITGKHLTKKSGYYHSEEQRYYLDWTDFGDTYLTARELLVFKYVLRGLSGPEIGKLLQLSEKTIESYFRFLRQKLGAKHKHDLLTVAIKYGLTHLIDIDLSS